MTTFQLLTYYPPLQDSLWYFAPKSLKKEKENHFKLSADYVERRLANKRNQPDIWNLVLTNEDAKNMTLDEMNANGSLFMCAGTETTATLLSGLTYLLLKNPQYMKRLTEEIRVQFGNEKDISMEVLQKLPYLNACIEEGFRVRAPVPCALPRVSPPGGTMICGKWVLGGVSLHI